MSKYLNARFSDLFESKELSDCVIYFDLDGSGKNFRRIEVHKLLLAIASPFFNNLLKGQKEEGKPLIVEDVDPEDFKELLRFIYTRQITITEDNVVGLLKASSRFQVRDVELKCLDHLLNHVNESNVWRSFELAKEHALQVLESKCVKFIQENAQKLFMARGFLILDSENFLEILSLPYLRIDSEVKLFQTLERYLRHNFMTRRTSRIVTKMVQQIRFRRFRASEFVRHVLDTSFLLSKEEQLTILANLIDPNCKQTWPKNFSYDTRDRRVPGRAK